jgi:hypothetical protein
LEIFSAYVCVPLMRRGGKAGAKPNNRRVAEERTDTQS